MPFISFDGARKLLETLQRFIKMSQAGLTDYQIDLQEDALRTSKALSTRQEGSPCQNLGIARGKELGPLSHLLRRESIALETLFECGKGGLGITCGKRNTSCAQS